MYDNLKYNSVIITQEQNFNVLIQKINKQFHNIHLIYKGNGANIQKLLKETQNVKFFKLEEITIKPDISQLSALLIFCYVDNYFPFEEFFNFLKNNKKHYIVISNSPIFKGVQLSENFQKIKEDVIKFLDIDIANDKSIISFNKDNIENFNLDNNNETKELERYTNSSNNYQDESIMKEHYIEEKFQEDTYSIYSSSTSTFETDSEDNIKLEKLPDRFIFEKIIDILINSKSNGKGLYDVKKSVEDYLNNKDCNVNYQNEEKETLLIIICKENYDINFVNLLLMKNCNVNISDNNGNTPLMYACKNGNLALVNNLIKFDAHLEDQNNDGLTPLIIASKYNHPDIINRLIEFGAKIYTQDKFNNTALHYSCKNNNIVGVNYIVRNYYNTEYLIKENNDGESPLFLSVMENSIIFMKLMKLNPKPDLSYQDSKYGNNILLFAIKNNYNKAAKEIINYIVNDSNSEYFYSLNNENESALSLAIKNDNNEIIEYINKSIKKLQKSSKLFCLADPNKSKIKTMELNSAIQCGKAHLVKYLIESNTYEKSSIISIKDINKKYPIFLAIENNNMTIVEHLINYALEHQIDINVRDDNGYTPLIFSYLNNFFDIFYYLLDKIKDVNQSDESGKTILSYAIEREDEKNVQLIVNKSKNIELSDSIDLAINKKYYKILDILFIAARSLVIESNRRESSKIINIIQNDFNIKDKEEMINYLISKGINVNSTDRDGNSALIYAVKYRYPTIVQNLIKYGANIHIENNEGKSAIDFVKRSDIEIKNILDSIFFINITEKLKDLNSRIRQADKESVQKFINNNKYVFNIIMNTRDIGENYPLLIAFNEQNLSIFKYLLDHGASCNIKNDDGTTLLSLAIQNDRYEFVDAMLESKIKINILERDYGGDCSLFEAIKRKNNISYMNKLVNYAISKHIDMNIINSNGDTPLTCMYRVSKGMFRIFLKRHCFNINQKDASGKSILFYIVDNDDIEFIEDVIVEGEADVNLVNSSNDTILDYAIFNEKVFNLLKILLQIHNIRNNKRNSQGETTLISIIKSPSKEYSLSNKEEIIKHIIDDHSINLVDSNGYSALAYAINLEYSSIVSLLIENGANVNIIDNYGFVPYDYAQKLRNLDILRKLKEKDAKPSMNSDEYQIMQINLIDIQGGVNDTSIKENNIFTAIDRGDINEIKHLIQINNNINFVNDFGDSPLNYAIYKGNVEVINILLNSGNKIILNKLNSRGETSIISIIKSEKIEDKDKEILISRLINEGMDVNLVDKDGNSPLMFAIYFGKLSLVKLLKNSGSRVDIKNNRGSSILNYISINNKEMLGYLESLDNSIKICSKSDKLIDAIKNQDSILLDQLLKKEEEKDRNSIINTKGIYGEYPLIVAFNINDFKIFKYLLDSGANLNIKNRDGISLLSLALKENRFINLIDPFLNKDVSERNSIDIAEKDGNGNCPLIEAINQGYCDNVRMLVRYGIKNKFDMSHITDNEGNTPLTLSYNRGFDEIFNYLIDKIEYFNINQEDSYGNTILYYAIKKNDIGTINNLEGKGAEITSNMIELIKDSQFINELIKNGNNHFLNRIFIKFNYSKDVILYDILLTFYINKTPISGKSMNELISKLVKVPVEEKMYETALNNNNVCSITVLLKNETNPFNEVKNRIKKYNFLSIAVNRQEVNLIRKTLFYIPLNEYPNSEDILIKSIGGNRNDISILIILVDSFVYKLKDIKGKNLKKIFNKTNFNFVLGKAIDGKNLPLIEYLISDKRFPFDANEISDNSFLVKAINSNDIEIQKYIKQGNVNYNLALVNAIKQNRIDVVKFLISMDIDDIDVNHEDEHGYTPVMYAVEKGNFSMIELLVNHHADINIRNSKGELRLLDCVGSRKDLLIQLYKLGMDENSSESDSSNETNSSDSDASTPTIKDNEIKKNQNITAYPVNTVNMNILNVYTVDKKIDFLKIKISNDEMNINEKFEKDNNDMKSVTPATYTNNEDNSFFIGDDSQTFIISSGSGPKSIISDIKSVISATYSNNVGNSSFIDESKSISGDPKSIISENVNTVINTEFSSGKVNSDYKNANVIEFLHNNSDEENSSSFSHRSTDSNIGSITIKKDIQEMDNKSISSDSSSTTSNSGSDSSLSLNFSSDKSNEKRLTKNTSSSSSKIYADSSDSDLSSESDSESDSESESDNSLSISDEESTSRDDDINQQSKNNEDDQFDKWDMTDNTSKFYLYKDYNNYSNKTQMDIEINFEKDIVKFLGEEKDEDKRSDQLVECNQTHMFDISVFFMENFKKHVVKEKAMNYFCNMIFSNFKMNPSEFIKGDLFKSVHTQNLYNRYMYDKNVKNKNSKFNQIKNIILLYLKKEPDQVSFLILFNEYYLFYKNLYESLEKNKIDGAYIMNVFYSNDLKYMLINIVKETYLNKYEPRINGKPAFSDIIIITSEDIYKDIKEEIKRTKMNIRQLICISFQDDAIKFYYDFQDYMATNFIVETKIEKYYVQSNYGLRLSYQFIKEKYIDQIKHVTDIKDIDSKDYNVYISYREKKMTPDIIKFIDTVICPPVNNKIIEQDCKLYFMYIKLDKIDKKKNPLNKYKLIGPLCMSKKEAECEANILFFKVLYHYGEIKLPVLEGRGLTYKNVPLSFNKNNSKSTLFSEDSFSRSSFLSNDSISKASLLSDEDLTKLKSTSSFRCPDIFSKDSWNSNQEAYSNNFYDPKNLYFVSYLEYNKGDTGKELFCYEDIVEVDSQGNKITNKIELCLGYITKKPIPTDIPIIDIREYKNDKYKFKLKAWNKFDINFCNNRNNMYEKDQIEDTNDIILDNSDCQSYLPVYFSDEELSMIQTFQGHSWKLLFGNNNLQPCELSDSSSEKLNDMYYIIPMSKKNDTIEINWDIMENINTTMENLQSENSITLGDWIYYANYFINCPSEVVHIHCEDNTFKDVPIQYKNNTFEENCYYLKAFHRDVTNRPDMEKKINDEIENMNENTQEIIEKSLKKVYFINKFDRTVCFFTGLDRKARKEDKFTLNRKSEEAKETTYQQFFEEKYKESIKDGYHYKYNNSPLFSYDAHSLIHSLQRDESDDNGEKKNIYIPELYCVFTVPHAWIKLLPLIPIFTYKIKILSFMNEFRYNIGLKQLTIETIYRASMSKSADPVIGEEHERLELLGDSVLKYLSSVNILNSYFNRNEDLLIHRRNDFIKNEFLIEQINNLGWKKYSIKQRYSMKNFCPPNYDIKQINSDLDKKTILEDKNDKSVADFYEALIGACFEDGIKSYKNGKLSIDKLYKESYSLNRKDIAKAIEEGIKLSKLLLIRTNNIITDHWKWKPSSVEKSVIKANRKNMQKISERLEHKFIENSSLFSVVDYTKKTYSDYSISDCKRLKFIGESVLDLITVIFYYSTKINAKPKDLTEYKHMAVSKNSYAKLFADLDILDKFNVDSKIRNEYRRAKQSKQSHNNENYPKYLSEIFEALVGSILIDNRYHFGRTNVELIGLLKKNLYESLDDRKKMFNVINSCIELIQSILKEHKDKQENQNIVGNQQVSFELKNGKMCMIVKDFTGKTIAFEEFAESESSNAKRYIATKIINIKNELDDELFRFAVLKRLSMDPEKPVSINFWNKESLITVDGGKSLIIACKNEYQNVVKMLIDKGANVNKSDVKGNSPLIIACKNKNENIVQILIDNGADVNKTDEDGNTPLIFACKNKNENIVKMLISNGATVNCKNKNKDTPLIVACENGNENIVRILIDQGADVNVINKKGYSLLNIGCQKNNENIVKCLIENGADVNKIDIDGETPLIKACKNEMENIVKCLIENGADINRKDRNGNTPFNIVSNNRNINLITCLMHHGANITSIMEDGSNSMKLIKACLDDDDEKVIDLLNNNNSVDVNAVDKNGNTPLIVTCRKGNEKIVKLLIEKGVDIDKENTDGDTPLIIACKYGKENIIKILVENGAKINKTDGQGNTPLRIAFKMKNQAILVYLMNKGAEFK